MTDMNNVSLIGRLTRDAELKYTSGGTAITTFSLAINRSRKDQSGQYVNDTTFVDCTLFGKFGESLKNYLVKGRQVAVTGYLKQERWEKEGQKFQRLTVGVNDLQLVGGSNSGNGSSGGYNDGYGNVEEITF